ncbi:MAG: 50S ribosomal protein L1 [Candidatus Phytoplasma cynodontis]|uniref:50S ribosomal protein L1 n=1 Tax='Cynodon dactylon' phytoplasma TaxID=295320 RepID=UPI001265BEAA|nr:50S ribosomal protein L1 ['Cynodon dactylon' phytoplasma]KAB8121999.1 50S ribosomal protein L1 ['Cynodon dactylon' phytoplasma]WIA07584.1 MAG: 50S ribosomal protein L1 [Candidatus Phytoplasma cynodontis]
MKRSKNYLSVMKIIDSTKLYEVTEAIDLMKKTNIAKFDATVECNCSLNLDPKKAEQNIRGSLILPRGIGKKWKIAVIAKGAKLKEAEENGADYFGEKELLEKISKNWTDFDILIATPEMMPMISKLGKILGPKGLMPNPKLGTVTDNINQIIKDIKKGRIEYKVDKNGNIHVVLGKCSFDNKKILENLIFFYKNLISIRPKTVKGNFIKSMNISLTMAPGIKIDHTTIDNKKVSFL